MITISETEIIARLQAEDKAAMQILFQKYYKTVCGKSYQVVKDKAAAEDIAQDVFVKLWQKRKQLNIKSSLGAYLQRMAFNESISYLRKHKKYMQQEEVTPQLPVEAESSEQLLLDNELNKHITNAIDALPHRCRLIFQMSRHEELTYKEIASKLDISIKTVENQMGKALRILRQRVQSYLQE